MGTCFNLNIKIYLIFVTLFFFFFFLVTLMSSWNTKKKTKGGASAGTWPWHLPFYTYIGDNMKFKKCVDQENNKTILPECTQS